jgi:iron complex outermembrane recepter protein
MVKYGVFLVGGSLLLFTNTIVAEEIEQVIVKATPVATEELKKVFSIAHYTEGEAGALSSDRLEDVLVSIPGVLTSNQNAGMETSFFVRGYRTDNGNIFLNGHQDIRRFYIRDLETVARVDLLKGHSSVLFGSGSPGGSVLYTTKLPQKNQQHRIKLSAGSYDHRRISFDSTGAIVGSAFSYRTVLVNQDAGYFMRNVDNDKKVGLLSLQWDYARDGNVRLETEYTRMENPYNFGTVRINGEILYDHSYVDPRAKSQRDYRRNSLYWEQAINEQWRINTALNYAVMDRQDTMMGFYYKLNETSLLGYWADIDNDFWQGNTKVELAGNVLTGEISHKVTMGVEYNKLNNHQDRIVSTAFTLDPVNPSFDRPIPGNTRPSSFHYRDEDQHFYLIDNIGINEGLDVSVGMRYSDFRNDNLLLDRVDAQQQVMASLVGVSWRLDEALEIYGNHTKSFEPNSGVDKAGQFFKPRAATQMEIGVRYSPLERLSMNVAVYDLTQSNLLTRDPQDRDYQIPTGERRTRGMEWEARLDVVQQFQLQASYSYIDNEVVEDFQGLLGKTASGVPRNMGAMRFNWKPNSEYSANLGLIGVGKRYGDPTNSFMLPGYARVDAGILYEHQALSLRLTIENLTDERYIAAPFAEDDLYQGKRRELIAGIGYRW